MLSPHHAWLCCVLSVVVHQAYETNYRIGSIKLTMGLEFSKLLGKCAIKLHTNKITLKRKVAFCEQLSWLCLLSEVTSDPIKDKIIYNFERKLY